MKEYWNVKDWLKIIAGIFVGLIALMFAGLLCVLIYRHDFSIDSIVSILLAFFSITIAILFYFKADETSSKFYVKSYDFMKDVSVTLGKIEERFGGKLDNINNTLLHLNTEKQEKVSALEAAEKSRENLFSEIVDRKDISKEEEEKLKKEINKKNMEIKKLRQSLASLEKKVDLIQKKNGEQILNEKVKTNLYEIFFRENS